MRCKYWTKEVGEICKLVKTLYEDMQEGAGGMLHIVLDDCNIEDDDIQWCIEYCNREENADRHDKEICLEIAQRMLGLNMEQRKLVYYQWDTIFCSENCGCCVITSDDDEW
jgi:hypothetical protein